LKEIQACSRGRKKGNKTGKENRSQEGNACNHLINDLEFVHHVPLPVAHYLFQIVGQQLATNIQSSALKNETIKHFQ
jgi:hypothetical protein